MATGEQNSYTDDKHKGLMFVEPSEKISAAPIIDELTRKMTAAYRAAQIPNIAYRGWHRCNCGANSSNKNYHLGNYVTNSLCIHYLAYHRDEIPQLELDKVKALTYGEAEPTEQELHFSEPSKQVGALRYRSL
jgi:hypothetical protein